MHTYRSHTCGAIRLDDAGQPARLSGWIHRKRDHGNLLFVDLRDHHGLAQCVIDTSNPNFPVLEGARLEAVVTCTGKLVKRSPETINDKLPTGQVELQVSTCEIQSEARSEERRVGKECRSR